MYMFLHTSGMGVYSPSFTFTFFFKNSKSISYEKVALVRKDACHEIEVYLFLAILFSE